MNKETADKVLSELGRLHSIEEIKFSLLRIKADVQALSVKIDENIAELINLQTQELELTKNGK